MRILHALYQPKTGGGCLRVVQDLATAALNHGHTVTILARDAEPFAQKGVERFFSGHKLWDLWRWWQWLRQHPQDVIHVHDRYCSLLLRWLPDSPPSLQTNHLVYRNRRRLTRFADVVVACSQVMDRHHADFFGLPSERRAWIPNGVPPHRPSPDPLPLMVQWLHNRRQRSICLTVARLSPQKGHSYLLEAILRLPPGLRQRWLFVMAGSGELLPALQQQTRQLGLQEDVIWLGHSPLIPEWLAVAEAFVLPSLFEGMPLALLEAMAAGLPCLATAVDGNLDVIRPEETGLLCPAADSLALSQALQRLLTDAHLRRRLGQGALEDYEARWSLERTWQRYEALYHRLHRSSLSQESGHAS